MNKVLIIFSLSTMVLLTSLIMAQDKVVVVPLGKKPAGDAVAADVRDGKTFSNDSGPATGTMPTQTFDPASADVPEGYYNATDLATEDTDLVNANIMKGVNIFGIPGTLKCITPTDMLDLDNQCAAHCLNTYGAGSPIATACVSGCNVYETNLVEFICN